VSPDTLKNPAMERPWVGPTGSPIDRQYTFRFFQARSGVSGRSQGLPRLDAVVAEIGTACKQEIRTAINSRGFMATGEAKVIDNAIMGLMQTQDQTVDAGTAAD
jgi:hypothetical protein